MWFNWFRSRTEDKAKEDDRARTQMELALSQPSEYDKLIEEIYLRQQKRDHEHQKRMLLLEQRKSIDIVVHYLARHGQISNDEYIKYMLDETGTYMPKTITDEDNKQR